MNPPINLPNPFVKSDSYGGSDKTVCVEIDPFGKVIHVEEFEITFPDPPTPLPTELEDTGVTPGIYGTNGPPVKIPSFEVDVKGRLISATENILPNATGDLCGSYPELELSLTGVSPGTYGSTDPNILIPVVTVDSKGRVTDVISESLPIVSGNGIEGTYPNLDLTSTGVFPGTYGTGDLIPEITVGSDGRVISVDVKPLTFSPVAGPDLSGTYPNLSLTTSGVTPGTYGSGILIPSLTIDSKGRVVSVTTSSVTPTTPSGAAGGDLVGTYPNPTLGVTGVISGTYGAATTIPILTIDSKGRITGVTTATLGSAAPTGSAGGDLTGTYPNPTLTTTAVVPGVYVHSTITVDGKGRITAAASGSVPSTPSLSAVVAVGNNTGGDVVVGGNLTLVGSINVPGSVTLSGTNVASLTLANGAGCMKGTIKFSISILSSWTVTITFSVARSDTNYNCLILPPTAGTSTERNTWISIGTQVFCTAKTVTSVTISGVAILALGFPAPMSFDYLII